MFSDCCTKPNKPALLQQQSTSRKNIEMTAPKGNKYAAKPDGEGHGDSFSLRAPSGLKGRAVQAARKRGIKLTAWLIEAIEEKIQREDSAPS